MSLAILIVYIVLLGLVLFLGYKVIKKILGMTVGEIISSVLAVVVPLLLLALVIPLIFSYLKT